MNLDSLCRKRAKRLGVKRGGQVGQRRVFFILDRATRKFHGDMGLWVQYLDVARRLRAYKRVSDILTTLVRLHPAKPEVWIYAAAYAIDEHGDMTEARSYMQRGLRFCKQSKKLWLEYEKVELAYLSKIAARRKILGLDPSERKIEMTLADEAKEDIIALPSITAEDLDPSLGDSDPLNRDRLSAAEASPALSGAIPLAIFDAAMEHFKDEDLGGRFFDLISEFPAIPSQGPILQHVVKSLQALNSSSSTTIDCFNRQPLVGISISSPEFPTALKEAFVRLKASINEHPSVDLAEKSLAWILPYAQENEDKDIQMVLSTIAGKSLGLYQSMVPNQRGGSEEELALILERLQAAGLDGVVKKSLPWAIQMWPSSEPLLRIRAMIQDETLKTDR